MSELNVGTVGISSNTAVLSYDWWTVFDDGTYLITFVTESSAKLVC